MTTLEKIQETVPLRNHTKAVPAFRCFAYQEAHNFFVAECIDLNLMVKAKSMNKAISSLNEAVGGYLAVVLDGDTTGLIPRYSSISRRILYHWVGVRYKLANFLNRPSTSRTPKRFRYPDHCHAA